MIIKGGKAQEHRGIGVRAPIADGMGGKNSWELVVK